MTNYNIISELLTIVGISDEEKGLILADYNNLLKLKAIEIAELTEEEMDSCYKGDTLDINMLVSKVGEKFENDEAKSKELELFIVKLNQDFVKLVAKAANDEQKKQMIEYLDEYEQSLNDMLESNNS